MRYILLICTLLFTTVYAKSAVESKIKKTSSKLNSYQKNYQNINKKMSQTAKAIIKETK